MRFKFHVYIFECLGEHLVAIVVGDVLMILGSQRRGQCPVLAMVEGLLWWLFLARQPSSPSLLLSTLTARARPTVSSVPSVVAPGLISISGLFFLARDFRAGWDLDTRPKASYKSWT